MTIKCKICNKNSFDNYRKLSYHLRTVHGLTAQEYHDIILKTSNICNNPDCNNVTKFKNLNIGYLKYCCNKCNTDHNAKSNHLKMKQLLMSEHGVDNCSKIPNINEARKRTNIHRYGGNAPLCSDSIKTKVKQTNIDKYGVKNVFQCNAIKIKSKQTCIEKYGVPNIMKVKEFAENKNIKTAQTKRTNLYNKMLDSTIFDVNFELHDIIGLQEYYTITCKNCGHIFERYFNDYKLSFKCPKCNIGSSIELKIKNFLDSYNINYITNDRSHINPYELDFYLPDHNLAIECHGLYWHSEQRLIQKNVNHPTRYHKIKHDLCKLNSIQLLQFYEDEIINRFEIVKNIILSKCKLLPRLTMARKCKIFEIDNSATNIFLDNNHIQGRNINKKCNIGAYYNNELVAVMSFAFIKDIIILDRFCTKCGYYIIGIANKLFTYFIKNNECNRIISFSDNRISNGALYNVMKFTKVVDVAPTYYYIFRNIRKHKSGFMKSKLKNRLENFDKKLTEYENMLNHGFDRTCCSFAPCP